MPWKLPGLLPVVAIVVVAVVVAAVLVLVLAMAVVDTAAAVVWVRLERLVLGWCLKCRCLTWW